MVPKWRPPRNEPGNAVAFKPAIDARLISPTLIPLYLLVFNEFLFSSFLDSFEASSYLISSVICSNADVSSTMIPGFPSGVCSSDPPYVLT